MINPDLLKKLNKNDEWYTLSYAVEPILEFLKPNSRILCPFDELDSEFVKILIIHGHTPHFSHIRDKIDFFTYTKDKVKDYDYIISNPPYSLRKQVFQHLEHLNRPYAMLVPLVSIVLKPIREKLENNELLVFDKRIKFKSGNGTICKNPPSETAYICKNVLPKQIMFRCLRNISDD